MVHPDPLLQSLFRVLRQQRLDPAAHRWTVPPWAHREECTGANERIAVTRDAIAASIQDPSGYSLSVLIAGIEVMIPGADEQSGFLLHFAGVIFDDRALRPIVDHGGQVQVIAARTTMSKYSATSLTQSNCGGE
jgi:hypothetical protein